MGFKYKPYKGKNKYHVRYSKKQKHFIAINNATEKQISGYQMTTDRNKAISNRSFHKMHKIPNKNDDRCCYVTDIETSYPSVNYSKPYGWVIAKEDEKMLNSFAKKKGSKRPNRFNKSKQVTRDPL